MGGMTRMLERALATAIALALVLAVPVATAAEPAPKGIEGAFELQGTRGYQLTAMVLSTGSSGILILYVEKKGEAAEYVVHGEVTTEGADFELGGLGAVDVTLRKTGRMETAHPACGKSFTVEAEEYVGTIEFHGEEGFTEVAATSTPLRFKPLANIVCPGFSVGETSGGVGPGVKLTVAQKDGPSLELERNHDGARVYYGARIKEKVGAITIQRAVSGHLASGSLHADPSLGHAIFAAGSPFSGRATYTGIHAPDLIRARPGKGIWRGSLKVAFPGRANVRLAGPGFKASIIHATRQESRF